MTFINSLTDADGDLFLSTGPGDFSNLLNDGWSYSASLFDSFNSKSAERVYRLSNKELDSLCYTSSKKELRSRLSQGWVNEGVAFKAAVTPTAGLTPIHQLYRVSDHTYLYAFDDDLIGQMIQDGFDDQGIAWYSPVNDGAFQIRSHSFDPVTGKLMMKYQLDEMQLSQFRNYVNEISLRAVHQDQDGQISAQDIGSSTLRFGKINKKTGNTVGKVVFNVIKTFQTRDINELTLTLNSKYGRTAAPDSLYGLVRTTAVHFSGSNLRDLTVVNSADVEELGYENLFHLFPANLDELAADPDPTPGGYYNETTIHDRNLKGADWSNARFSYASIRNNQLSGAKLTNTSFEIAQVRFLKNTYYPSFVYDNDLSSANLGGMQYIIAPGLGNWNKGQNIVSDYAGKLEMPMNYQNELFSIKPTRITVRNQSQQSIEVNMASPQYFLMQAIGPGESVALPGTAYSDWASKQFPFVNFYGGRDDVYVSIWSAQRENVGLFSARNKVTPATFYVNGEQQEDVGSFKFASWEYNPGDVDGFKNWTINVR